MSDDDHSDRDDCERLRQYRDKLARERTPEQQAELDAWLKEFDEAWEAADRREFYRLFDEALAAGADPSEVARARRAYDLTVEHNCSIDEAFEIIAREELRASGQYTREQIRPEVFRLASYKKSRCS